MSTPLSAVPSFCEVRSPLVLDAEDCEAIFRSSTSGTTGAELTIAIPTFKRPELLKQALSSIRSLHGIIPYEVVVVDNDADRASDSLESTVREFQDLPLVLYRNSENVGMFGNWNRCFLLPNTRWVSILNDDDLLLPNFLQQLDALRKEVPEGWAYLQFGYGVLDERIQDSALRVNYAHTSAQGEDARELTLPALLAGNTRAGSLAMVFDRAQAVAAGGFDAKEYPTADYRFAARLLTDGGKAWEDRTAVALYRVFQNESLKPEVMAGFVSNDYRMLRESQKFLRTPPLLVNFYAYIRALAYYYRLQKTWNVYPSKQALKNATGIVPRDNLLESFTTRLLARLLKRSIY